MGGIEAEAVMLGQPISMVLPEVVGYKLHGTPEKLITSTDIVLTVTKVITLTVFMQLLLHIIFTITDVIAFLSPVLSAPPSGGCSGEVCGVFRPGRGSAVHC